MINYVIIEDEIAGQRNLFSKISSEYPECQLLKIIDNKEEAVTFLKTNNVDLVFLDVQIKGGTGLEVLKEIETRSFEVIFITAFNKYAIEALNNAAAYYVLKPIRNSDLRKAMKTVLSRLKSVVKEGSILVPNKGIYHFVCLGDIVYLESDGSYTKIITMDKNYLSSKSIGYYEQTLSKENFIRTHHSFIVNINAIQLLIKGRSGVLEMKNGIEIPVSQRRKALFLKYFNEAQLK